MKYVRKIPQKPNFQSKKIRIWEKMLGKNGINSKLKHRKAHNSILSVRFGDPYGRLGDCCRIRESWHVCHLIKTEACGNLEKVSFIRNDWMFLCFLKLLIIIVCLIYCSSGKSKDQQGASMSDPGTGRETSDSSKRVLHDQGVDLCFICVIKFTNRSHVKNLLWWQS